METFRARWWTAAEGGRVKCALCPRQCVISEGRAGFCGVRVNQGGALASLSYGRPVSIAVDPIEKKPLNHFMPGSRTFSLGTFGCNLGCTFCQNYGISRECYMEDGEYRFMEPERLVRMAIAQRCPSISFTYNEPTVFAEYAMDTAKLAHEAGLRTVLVSNGYISDEASDQLYPLMDAANIDMKGFSEDFYADMCQGSLGPVLNSIAKLHRLGTHLEITTLVIPGKNDGKESTEAWLDWAAENLGRDVPLHFSAYFPAYRCRIPRTSPATLHEIRRLALDRGFRHVHLGNI